MTDQHPDQHPDHGPLVGGTPPSAGADPSSGTLAYLGVSCDGDDFCENGIAGDFRVRLDDDKDTRLGYVLDHAAAQGWQVRGREHPQMALTYCPEHRTDR